MTTRYGKFGDTSAHAIYGLGGDDSAHAVYTPTKIASRNIPTLTGTQYGTLSSVVSLASGDTVERKFATITSGASMFFFGHSATPASAEFDAGNLLQLVGGTATIDGTAVADGASIAAYQDGKVHTLLFTASGSFSVGYLNQSGSSSGYFLGQDFSAVFTVSGVITNYVFDSGSTVEQYARGSDTLKVTFTAFTSANWARYTLQRNIVHDTGTITEAWVGDNLVVNGRFDADTDWTKGAGWSIGSGVASITTSGSTNTIYQSSITSEDSLYLMKVNQVSLAAQSFKFYAGGALLAIDTALGSHTGIITANADGLAGIACGLAGTTGSIDNVSVQHLLEVV